jgi:hypothetical protein
LGKFQINSKGYQLANSLQSSSSSASPYFKDRIAANKKVEEEKEEDEEIVGAELESSRHFLMKPSAHFGNEDEEEKEISGGLTRLK